MTYVQKDFVLKTTLSKSCSLTLVISIARASSLKPALQFTIYSYMIITTIQHLEIRNSQKVFP